MAEGNSVGAEVVRINATDADSGLNSELRYSLTPVDATPQPGWARLSQGCSPKEKSGGTPETRLRQRFLNNLGLHTCCTEIILHCVSVSNQLQQWTITFARISVQKSGGVGDASPCRKKVGGTPSSRVPAPLHPCTASCLSSLFTAPLSTWAWPCSQSNASVLRSSKC